MSRITVIDPCKWWFESQEGKSNGNSFSLIIWKASLLSACEMQKGVHRDKGKENPCEEEGSIDNRGIGINGSLFLEGSLPVYIFLPYCKN